MTQESTQNLQVTVTAVPVKIQDGIRLDLNLTNIPQDFFGLAFHLKIRGGEWQLVKYELSDAFDALQKPFVLVSTKADSGAGSASGSDSASGALAGADAGAQAGTATGAGGNGEIIFGLSLQRGQNLNLSSGKILSFYLKTAVPNLKFAFSDQVLSVLQENRQDLGGVTWLAADLKSEQFGQAAILAVPSVSPGKARINGDQLVQVYSFLGVVLLVLLLILSGYYIYKRNK